MSNAIDRLGASAALSYKHAKRHPERNGDAWVLACQIDNLTAEIDVLRGEGCNVDGDGPCGACIKCALAGRYVGPIRA